MFTSYVQVDSTSSPLSVEVSAIVGKVGVTIVLNERGSHYDHIFEANIKADEANMFETRFPYSHYMLSINKMEGLIKLNNVKRKQIIKSTPVLEQFDKVIVVKCMLSSIIG